MYFKFNINTTDNDYLDYNMFWAIKSPYGKKQMIKFRIILAVLFGVVSLVSLYGGNFSTEAFIDTIPYLIMLVLFQVIFNPLFVWILKGHVKSLKKSGKMGYSPSSEMEFYEKEFIEITPSNKTEQKYSSIERVSVIGDKVIYIHVNNVMAYIIPFSCFESKNHYEDFIAFLKTKCANVDTY